MRQTARRGVERTGGRRVHYAWVVVAVTFAVLIATAGTRAAPSVFLKPWQAEYGWSKSQISFAVAISLFIFGFGGPISGILIDRFGLRRVMLGGMILSIAGLAPLFALTDQWQLHLFWGLTAGVGTGVLGSVLGATVANRWFNTRRSLVVGLFGGATAAGQLLLFTPMVALTTTYGWRSALLLLVGLIALLIVPVFFLMRNRPQDIGLDPIGGTEAITVSGIIAPAAKKTGLRDALRTRDFWLLAASFFVCGYTTNGLIQTHLLTHAVEHGFVEVETSGAISLMGGMNIVGTLISGWLCDRIDNRKLLAGYYAFRALSLFALPFIIDLRGLLIFAVVYGLDWIATVPPTVNIIGMRFGRASVPTLYGWIFCAHMIGAGIAAFAGGIARDVLGDYHIAFISAGVLGLVAVTLAMSISDVRRPQTDASEVSPADA